MISREEIHSKLFVAFAVMTVAFLPFSIKWCSAAIVLLTLNWIVEGRFKDKLQALKGNKLIWLFSGFYLLHIAGLLFTQNIDNGLFDLEKKASLFIFPIVLGTSRKLSSEEVNTIFSVFIISCLTAIAVSLIFIAFSGSVIADPEHLNFDYLNKDKFRHAFPGSSAIWNKISYIGFGSFIQLHPTYFSLYIAFAIALLLYQCHMGFARFSFLKKLIVVLTLLVFITALVFLSSRIVLIAFLILCVFSVSYYFIRKQKYSRGAFYSFIFISVIILLIYINPVTRFRLIQEPLNTGFSYPGATDYWNSWNLRFLEWNSSMNIIKNNWLTGVGTGDTQEYLNREYKKVELGIFQGGLNAHNQYLQTMLDLGIAGLLVLMVSVCRPFQIAWKEGQGVYIVFIFLFAMCSLSESMLEAQKGVVFYAFFNSLLVFHVFPLIPKKYA